MKIGKLNQKSYQPLVASSQAVPEPTSSVLLIAAACLHFGAQRGRNWAAISPSMGERCIVLLVIVFAATVLSLTSPAAGDILYLGSQGPGRHIVEVNSSGTVSVFTSLPAGAVYAAGVAFDLSGNLYASDPNKDTISKITPVGTVSLFKSLPSFSFPTSLAFDGNGDLYVANNGANQINKITPNGTLSIFASLPGGSDSGGLAFDDSGNLYVARGDADQIYKITPEGTPTLFATLSANSIPLGLAFDGIGNLYETGLDNKVRKITASGEVSLFATLPNYTSPEAVGLAFDSNGNLYAAGLSGEVSKITPDGTVSLFATATNQSLLYIAVTDDLGHPLALPPNSLAADFDNDGDVDGRDFLVWQRGGSPGPLSSGDLALWRGQYGNPPLVATSKAVPEPAGTCLLAIGAGLITMLRRKKVVSDTV